MDWSDFLGAGNRELVARTIAFLPTALAAALVLSVGVTAAWVVRRLLIREQNRFRLEALYSAAGVTGLLKKTSSGLEPCRLVANLFFFIVFCGVAVVALEILGLQVASTLAGRLLAYLPNVGIAFFIIVVGTYLSRRAKDVVENKLQMWRHPYLPRSAGSIARGLSIFVTVTVAAYQVGIARGLLTSIFVTLIGGASLAVFLSFGLAGAEIGKAVVAGGIWLRATSLERPPDLSPKQYELFVFLRSFTARNNRSPLIREMQEAIGNKSTKAVAFKLEQLQRKGYIKREKGKHRGIIILK